MKGLELSKKYYALYGKPMLEKDFPALLPYLAVGFVGSGSDRFGFDDEVSRDHDFEPGFCIFLPGEETVDRRQAFLLERAYQKLPKEFEGVKRGMLSPVGGNRNGVIRTADFYQAAVGQADGALSMDAWLHIPDYALAEATNGEVYDDPYGEFTRIRQHLLSMPRDAWLKRLAGNLLLMAQAGQYNFPRCLRHGEPEAAQLTLMTFVEAAMKTAFMLRGRYMPYYKWSFRALRELEPESRLPDQLSFLLFGDNSSEWMAQQKIDVIETIAGEVIQKLQEKELTKAVCGDLEKHAYSVNDGIADGDVRNLHILAAV